MNGIADTAICGGLAGAALDLLDFRLSPDVTDVSGMPDSGEIPFFSAALEREREKATSPFSYLFDVFACTDFEAMAVVFAFLAATDAETAEKIARLGDDRRFGIVTPYVLALLYGGDGGFDDVAQFFTSSSKLLTVFFGKDGACRLRGELAIDMRIRDFIACPEKRMKYYDCASVCKGDGVKCRGTLPEKLAGYISKGGFGRTVFEIWGERGSGRRSAAVKTAGILGVSLLEISFDSVLRGDITTHDAVREMFITQSVLLLSGVPADAAEETGDETKRSLLKELVSAILDSAPYCFVTGEAPIFRIASGISVRRFAMDELTLSEAEEIWCAESAKYKLDPSVSFSELAGEFRMTPARIIEALGSAAASAEMYGDGVIHFGELKSGCYASLEAGMGNKAVKIGRLFTWDDLVIPAPQKKLLKAACDQVRYKYKVYNTWGFDAKISYGRGVSMAFSGPPGTGKTMAAQVVASELGLDIYKIDLATVVSKYIGETEKNLSEIFDRARKSQVVLFFDEADVLFSKRTEVKDSNDKYSNMEAAFLLQKMEEYDGITVLATNYMQNFDEAFKRRLKFLIDFPFPDAGMREIIWHKSFPPQLPAGDIDFAFLTSHFELSGSNIKNIVLHAAFLAASDGSDRLGMKHVLSAVKNEYAKSGKVFSKEDAGEYFMLL